MRQTPGPPWAAGVIFLLAAASLASAQASLSLRDILRKNIEASGGKATLAAVRNLSFKTGSQRHFASAAGDLKVLTGKDPVVTEAVLASGGRVRRNSFGTTSDVTGPERTVFRTLGKLYAGLFSLAKFQGELVLVGTRSFGPEKFYHLTTKGGAGPVAVHFYLRADDFLLKRLVFQGATPEGDRVEVNYDFAPFEEAEGGLRLPSGWFVSQVGSRGNLVEMSDVKTNLPLGKDFFAGAECNAGQAEASPGRMKGNVLDWNSSPFGLTIVTNWTKKDADRAGLRTGDKLLLLLDEDEYELTFYGSAKELPPPNEQAKGTRLLAPQPWGGEAFAVQVIGGETGAAVAKLKPLAPISVRKIAN